MKNVHDFTDCVHIDKDLGRSKRRQKCEMMPLLIQTKHFEPNGMLLLVFTVEDGNSLCIIILLLIFTTFADYMTVILFHIY